MPIPYERLISTIDDAKREIIGAILDSGSSISLIPQSLRERIEARLTGKDTIVDILEREADRWLYEVKIAFRNYPNLKLPLAIQIAEGGFRARGTEYAIIGRDILNSFKLVLDGPRLEFDITQDLTE